MMPTSPSPPLKFRTAGFPRYGFKASMSDEVFQTSDEVKLTPNMPSTRERYAPSFAHLRTAIGSWALSPTRSAPPRAAVRAATAALPQGSLAPERVLLSRSITAYDPIRLSRRHATISRHCRLYVAPSLCGSASATRETSPTFIAVLSTRAIDHTPVGPRCCPVTVRIAIPGFLGFTTSRHPREPVSASNIRRGVRFRRCIVRFMLRPMCLPRPPDWLDTDGITCVPSMRLRTLSPPLLAPAVTDRRWEST